MHDHDNSPLSGLFGLANASEGASILSAGESSFSLLAQTASHAVAETAAGEAFIADGETSRIAFEYRRGIGERLEVGVEIPWLTHQRGGLDSFIDGWHDFFGFPDGARDDRPRDLLEFAYIDSGARRVDLTRSTSGLGDLRFVAGYRLPGSDSLALRFGLKLPTGDDESLLGSGGTDVTVGIAGGSRSLFGSSNWSSFYSAHAAWLGEPRYLADLHESIVLQGAAGLSWQALERLSLTVQGFVRSAHYDSRIEMLGDTAVSVTVGGTIRLGDAFDLQLSVGEDIKVSSTPDVTFQAALRYAPRR